MATGIQCEDCGAEMPSHGSAQMHRLRAHPPTPSTAPPGAAPAMAPAEATGGPREAPTGRRPRGTGRRGTAVPLALAIVVLLSGGAVAAARSRPAEPVGPTDAELLATIQGAVFRPADFPAGWAADPTEPDDAPDPADRALADCLGVVYDDAAAPSAESSFSSEGLSVGSEFEIAPTLERARADFSALAAAGAPGCFEQALRSSPDADKPADVTFEVTVVRADPPPAFAGEASAFRATIELHKGRVTVPMTFEIIMIQHGRIEATLMTMSTAGKPFPADLWQSLTTTMAGRLAG